jgi:hypothetical protein
MPLASGVWIHDSCWHDYCYNNNKRACNTQIEGDLF